MTQPPAASRLPSCAKEGISSTSVYIGGREVLMFPNGGSLIYTLPVTIYLDDKRRSMADLVGKLQHLVAGIPLLMVGLTNLNDEAERLVGGLEVAIAAALFVAFVYELRLHRRKTSHSSGTHHHPSLGWFDLAAGALLIFETSHGTHLKPIYERAPFFAGVVAIVMGLAHPRIHGMREKRQYLKLSETGLEFRLSRIRNLSLQWRDLAAVDVSSSAASFRRKDGRLKSIHLGRFRNADALRQGIVDHARLAGLESSAPAAVAITDSQG